MSKNITAWLTDREILELIGERLRLKRLLLNITQAELAYEIGVSKLTIHKIENGSNSKLENFIALIRFFDELDKFDRLLKIDSQSPKELFEINKIDSKKRARKKND